MPWNLRVWWRYVGLTGSNVVSVFQIEQRPAFKTMGLRASFLRCLVFERRHPEGSSGICYTSYLELIFLLSCKESRVSCASPFSDPGYQLVGLFFSAGSVNHYVTEFRVSGKRHESKF